MFLYDCSRQGVHPLDKLIHFTKRGGRYVPITSIDFLRARAESTGEYAGNDDPLFDEDSNPPAWARVTVYRMVKGTRCPFTATARWSEYYPGKQQGFMWDKMPYLMLGKVAESLALRKAFPKALHGMYSKEELDQAKETSPQTQRVVEQAKEVFPEAEVQEITAMPKNKSSDSKSEFKVVKDEPVEKPTTKKKAAKKKAPKDNQPYYTVDGDRINFHRCFIVKDQLKEMGFRYDPDAKTWYAPKSDDMLKKIDDFGFEKK